MLKPFLCIVFYVVFVKCHPTMYRMNENNVLEADLVPVSSTVIPLPVYQVGYGIDVLSSHKERNAIKPEGPIYLETVHNKKKPIPAAKSKPSSDVSSVKQVSKAEYEN
ncbi:uncharacterized protein [Diabrotica undecimpunctata]|uniref:uncharacterized protein n=1 Tax=Diabrotica undecimpunctata TaxID=50387 RepID=UPI003B631971